MASNQPSSSPPPSPPSPSKPQSVAEEQQQEEEDQYINMEVSSTTSSSNVREFEFHARGSITSPADELFYKGKLLPLHLPPRLQMVQKLLQSTNNGGFEHKLQDPFEESDELSKTELSRARSEIDPDEFFFVWSSEANGFVSEEHQNVRKFQTWCKKIKKSHLGQKIRASRTYLRSLFIKPCPNLNPNPKPEEEEEEGLKHCFNRYVKPFGQIDNNVQRRSFSGAIKCSSSSSSTTSSSSSSSSSSFSFSSSNGYYDLHVLKRSNSANSELESSIAGAIAHCKQSGTCLVRVK